MVAIGFTVFKDKILNCEKTQTIRPYSRKRWVSILNNKKLQLYWKLRTKNTEFLREVTVTDLFKIIFSTLYDDLGHECWTIYRFDGQKWREMTREEIEELARRDGFNSMYDMLLWFKDRYGDALWGKEFMVIRWRC